MSDRTKADDLRLEHMLAVHAQLLLGQKRAPEHRLRHDRLVGARRNVRRQDRAAVGVVALEMGGVDDDTANVAAPG